MISNFALLFVGSVICSKFCDISWHALEKFVFFICIVTNFQHNYSLSENFEHIIVDSVTLQTLLEKYKFEQLHLLKLDIEGAEVEVLKDMMKNKIYPTQIAVEFDGFNSPSKKALSDYYEVDSQLRANGYLCYDFDGLADFLYVQSNRVKEELNNV